MRNNGNYYKFFLCTLTRISVDNNQLMAITLVSVTDMVTLRQYWFLTLHVRSVFPGGSKRFRACLMRVSPPHQAPAMDKWILGLDTELFAVSDAISPADFWGPVQHP